MTSLKLPSRISGFIIGLLVLVCLSPAVVLLFGNDGEPKRGAERKASENPSSGALVEDKNGSDSADKPTDSAKGSVSQSQPDDDSFVPERAPKQKVFRGGKSMTDQSGGYGSKSAAAGKKGTKRGDVGGPMGGSDMQGGMPPGSGAPPAMGPMGKGRMGGSAMDAMPPMGGSGMGGSGMGGMRPMGSGKSAMGMGSREVPRAAKLYVEGVSIILKQSETGDTLWGYSDKLGKWSKLAIPKGTDLLTPVVGANVGAYVGNGRIYAFSGSTGRWAELKTAASPTVSASKISVTDGDQVFIFSDVHGRWSSNAEASDDPPATADPSDPNNLKTSSLLTDDAGRRIEMGDFDSDGRLDVVIRPTRGRQHTNATVPREHQKEWESYTRGLSKPGSPDTPTKMSAADLLAAFQERFHESERRTMQAAEEYREARRRGGEKDPQTLALGAMLAKLVAESFDRRQQAQRLEAEILRRRLRRVEERLTDRERIKSRIIEHRLEELQNTNVRWDAETGQRTVVKGDLVARAIDPRFDGQPPPNADIDPQNTDGVGAVRDLRADGIRPHFVVREPGESAGQSVMRVRSEPAVCVRGVLPWDELMQNPAAVASHTRDRQRPATIELSDFKIERQQAAGTPATWDDIPWVACSIEKSINVLSSLDLDTDAAPEMVRSEALTSPLPRLSDGAWDDRVLHPKLMNAGNDAVPNVLFRFLDFDVKAGESYRYRVKLLYTVVKNGELQPGPWSKPSTVASVTDSAE